MKDIKAAVVGLGLGRHFVAACARSSLVGRLVICDTDQARGDQARAETPEIAAAYTELEAMVRAEKPDVVCIVTPDHMHRPQAELCLTAGANVLMTKPLATTLEDGKAIVRAAERSGRKLMVAHERRFRTRVKALKALLASGELGEIIMVQANQISDKRAQFAKSPWYASPTAGRSAVVGTGIHEIDLLRFLVGRPLLGVSAVGNRIGGMVFPADKTTATVLRFDGGVIGQTAVSYECHWPRDRPPEHFLLVATRGIVANDKLSREGRDGWETLPGDPSEIAVGCGGAVDAFLDALVNGKEIPVPPRDAYATLAACVAADVSSATGRTVAPDPADFA
jgi:predicted dehydrogenase